MDKSAPSKWALERALKFNGHIECKCAVREGKSPCGFCRDMALEFDAIAGCKLVKTSKQEIYHYLSALEKRIKVVEAKVESLLELSPELEPEAIPSDKKEY